MKKMFDFSKCDYRECSFNNVYQPVIDAVFSGDVYLFSYFYDRLKPFASEETSINEIEQIAKTYLVLANSNSGELYTAVPHELLAAEWFYCVAKLYINPVAKVDCLFALIYQYPILKKNPGKAVTHHFTLATF